MNVNGNLVVVGDVSRPDKDNSALDMKGDSLGTRRQDWLSEYIEWLNMILAHWMWN